MKFIDLVPGMVIEVFKGDQKVDEGVFAGMSADDLLLINRENGTVGGFSRQISEGFTYKKVEKHAPVAWSIYGWDFVRES